MFRDNGAGDGYSHNLYINEILYDRLTGERGTDSYELDLPNGGLSFVIGAVLEQGPATQNPSMLAYGEEGALNPDSHVYVVNDTFANDLHRGAAVMVCAGVGAPVMAENDISAGGGVFVGQAGARLRHNCLTARPGFVAADRYDYRLRASSACRRGGRRPGRAQGYPLAPRFQYVGVAAEVRRIDGGTVAGALGRSVP